MGKRGPKPTLCEHGVLGKSKCAKCNCEKVKNWRSSNKQAAQAIAKRWNDKQSFEAKQKAALRIAKTGK